MKEDDICDLLKFERKMLRGRISTLKNDKFLQTRLRMETVDGKSQKVNYYYINYKVWERLNNYDNNSYISLSFKFYRFLSTLSSINWTIWGKKWKLQKEMLQVEPASTVQTAKKISPILKQTDSSIQMILLVNSLATSVGMVW